MNSLDTVSWKGMGGYDMGYPTKYITPFRVVIEIIKDIIKVNYYNFHERIDLSYYKVIY